MEIKRSNSGKYLAVKVFDAKDHFEIDRQNSLLMYENPMECGILYRGEELKGSEILGLISEIVENEDSEYYKPCELPGWINYNIPVEEWSQWLIIQLSGNSGKL